MYTITHISTHKHTLTHTHMHTQTPTPTLTRTPTHGQHDDLRGKRLGGRDPNFGTGMEVDSSIRLPRDSRAHRIADAHDLDIIL